MAIQSHTDVEFDEVVDAAIKLSGVSQDRFNAIDNLPPGELIIKMGEMQLCVLAVSAKWNTSPNLSTSLACSNIFFDSGNEYGANVFSESARGSVVLVCRGHCSIADKATNAAKAGAIAILVHDNESNRALGCMTASTSQPSIPGFMISLESGRKVKEALSKAWCVSIASAELRPPTFFACIGGEEPIQRLVTKFYRRVFSDSESWFREIFEGRNENAAIQNLADFLAERFGGPKSFSSRKGHPQLIARHMVYEIKEKAAVRWLQHMEASVDEMQEFDENSVALLKDYFRYQAHFIGYSCGVAQGHLASSSKTHSGHSCDSGGCHQSISNACDSTKTTTLLWRPYPFTSVFLGLATCLSLSFVARWACTSKVRR